MRERAEDWKFPEPVVNKDREGLAPNLWQKGW